MDSEILVVDDSAAIRKILQRVLRQTGMSIGTIYEAGDGQEALETLRNHKIDLVLSDINMPNMTGIEMLRSLRKLAPYKFTPIVLVTTESQPEKKQEGKAAGATGWIVKPFEPEQLLAVVTKVLRC